MINEWKDCITVQDLAAAQARGDDIMEWRESSGRTWDGAAWRQGSQYRCRPAQPACKEVTRFPTMLDAERAKYVAREVQYEEKINSLRMQIMMLRDGLAMAVSIIGHPDDVGTKHLQKILTDTDGARP